MKDGRSSVSSWHYCKYVIGADNHLLACPVDTVLTSPQILNVPLLLLANKQDAPGSLGIEAIRESYESWYQGKKESARRRYGEGEDGRLERFASLDVMAISALEGWVFNYGFESFGS